MNKAKKLPIEYKLDSISGAVLGRDTQPIHYIQYRIELKEKLIICNEFPVFEIVSCDIVDYTHMVNPFIELTDERYGETYCLETANIKGFQKVNFDAEAWNESLSDE